MSEEARRIRFSCDGPNSPAYGCSEPGNNSGVYVQVEHYDDLRTQLAELQGVVDRLPKTADEVPVVPGMGVFTLETVDKTPWPWRVKSFNQGAYHGTPGYPNGDWAVWLEDDEVGVVPFAAWDIYSTREAALASQGGEGADG